MKKLLISLAVLVAATVMFQCSIANAQPAMAQSCYSRVFMIKLLHNQYQERQFALGFTQKNYVVELYLSPRNDSWTFIKTHPNGTSCFIDSGTEWIMRKAVEKSEKIKAIQ